MEIRICNKGDGGSARKLKMNVRNAIKAVTEWIKMAKYLNIIDNKMLLRGQIE